MPLYEYKCDGCGEVFEKIEKFADEPLKVHDTCGGPVHRLMSAPAFQFKGTGWYVTDYAKGGSSAPGKGESGKSDGDKGESGKSDSSGKKESSGKNDSSGKNESSNKSDSSGKSDSSSKTSTDTATKSDSKPAPSSDKSKSD